jgi:hypothetical protein
MAFGPTANNKTPIVLRIDEGSVKLLEEQRNTNNFTLRKLPVVISRVDNSSTKKDSDALVEEIIPQLENLVPGDTESQSETEPMTQ